MTVAPATARGQRTRERILDAAERLWSERGVAGVSMRQIRIAAGQANSSALQFHFGGRDGLLRALADRHVPQVAAIQDRTLAALEATGRGDDPAGLVEVLIGAPADYLRRGPSARAWVRIAAEQVARPDLPLEALSNGAPAAAMTAGRRLHRHLATMMPPGVAVERLVAVGAACSHLCADRARLEEAGPAAARAALPFAAWRANLLAMATGALLAPAPGGSDPAGPA